MRDAQLLHQAATLLVQRGHVRDQRVQRMAATPVEQWNPLLVQAAIPTLAGFSSTLQQMGFDPLQLTLPPLGGPPQPAPSAVVKHPPPPPPDTHPPRPKKDASAPLVYDHTIDGLRGIPVSDLKAVGKKTEKRFADYGLRTLYELLTHVPLRYVNRKAVKPLRECVVGEQAAIIGEVVSAIPTRVGKRRAAKINVRCAGATLECTHFNAAWKAETVSPGDEVVVLGKLTEWIDNRGEVHLQMSNPLLERIGSRTMPIVPIYPQSAKSQVTTWDIHRAARETVQRMGELVDPVPVDLVTGGPHIMPRGQAFRLMHGPQDTGDEEKARNRLAYDELFRMQLALQMRRHAAAAKPAHRHSTTGHLTWQLLRSLPFQLTEAQNTVLRDIANDLRGPAAMHRFVQGEVGSGKTLVALLAMLMAVEGGHQAAFMAPTGVLAEQHYQELSDRLTGIVKDDGTPLRVEYVSGSAKGQAKIKQAIARGEVDIAVGTSALIADSVTFRSLGLAVVDEEHRFGVDQRAALASKGPAGTVADLMVMTATPIPRTMAMTVFGDLDESVINQVPAGRQPRQTSWVETGADTTNQADPTWQLMRRAVEEGRQGYVVCPLVDGQDTTETKAAASAVAVLEELKGGALAGLRLGMMHGKMSRDERDAIKSAFTEGRIDVLVATTVIEVGVNVPNASVMVILEPKNFGISQLHQLRGRVGRGQHPAYCILAGEAPSQETRRRLEAIVDSDDGFYLAEVDLANRGHGSVLGSRQSGNSDLRVADLARDIELLRVAREDAAKVVAVDPTVTRWSILRHEVETAVGSDAIRYLTAS